jgi:hypothetical protein
MIKTMQARYPGRDAITGARINPGDEIQFDTITRKAWIAEPGDMARPFASNGAITFYGENGANTFYRNPRGRCIDAPCCGCCTI